ncbi:SDR family NAD(P)-dependent oxidoreductase [Alterinioella nitratireducens]|uniref:SDR family NAD(P)-dependent oxidoreductase n=1 Tax=Alterinioella nitratireducens TaxID=2735915 RepID=UPI0040588E7D
MTGRLDGKAAIVTGGARGLGLVFVRALLAEGAQVLAVDVADIGAAEAAGARAMRADITQAAGEVARACQEAFGRIDILVNNAALYASLPVARYDAIDLETWDRVMAVNVTGTYKMIRATAPVMEVAGAGKIVNITSGTVKKGMPGMLHYVASKGAVQAMTRALSRELGPSGVCVNNLAPGLTLSDSILANPDHVEATRAKVLASRAIPRDGLPEDLVGALVFLCSDESDFMTGQTVAVDGGSVNT